MSTEEIWKAIYNGKELKNFDYQTQLKKAKVNCGHAGSLWIIPGDEIVFEPVQRDVPPFLAQKESPEEWNHYPGFLRDNIRLLRSDATRLSRKYKEFTEYPKSQPLDLSQIAKYSYDIDCADMEDDLELPSTESLSGSQRPSAAELFSNTGRRKSYVNTEISDFENTALALKTKPELKLLGKEHKIIFSYNSKLPLGKIYADKNSEGNSKDSQKSRRRTIAIDEIVLEWESNNSVKSIGEIAFFDCKEKRKVSESRWFEFPSGQKQHKLPISLWFTTNFHSEVVLCVRMHKVFQGDLSTWIDSYQKGKDSIEKVCAAYSQPFGWWAANVYGETTTNGDLILENLKITEELLSRFDESKYSEDEFYGMITPVKTKNQGGSKKLPKSIPLKISYVIREVGKTSKQNLSSVCLAELSIPDSVVVHGLQPSHHLYCSPLALNFYRTNSNWKNISIKIQMCKNDKVEDSSRFIKCIETPTGELVDSWSTSILYHNRNPNFMEEIKIRLPNALQKVHLFFTYSQVSYTNQREDKIIGHSYLQLVDDIGCFVADKVHEVSIFQQLVDQYTTADGEITKILDNGKTVLQLRTHLLSSLFTCDQPLAHFFHTTDIGTPKNIEDSNVIPKITDVSIRDLSVFGPTIFNRLLSIICSPDSPDTLSKRAIIAVAEIAEILEAKSNGTKPLVIESYLKEVFIHSTTCVRYLHVEIVRLWIGIIRESNPAAKCLFKMSWVLFDLIWKSILETQKYRDQTVTSPFVEDLRILRQEFSNEINRSAKAGYNIAKVLNINMAKFMSNLICCMSANVIFVEIINHVESFNDELPISTYLKFDFIQEICAYEFAIQYSIPVSHLESKDHPKKLIGEYRRFFFANIVVKEVIKSFQSPNAEIRQKAAKSVKMILEKVEADIRFSDTERTLIFSMYLPLLSAIADICSDENMKLCKDIENNRDLCLVVLYILRYSVRELLVKWVYEYSCKPVFVLLSGLAKHFEYMGQAKIAENLLKGNSQTLGINTDAAKRFIENSYKSRPGTVGNGNLREIRGEKQQRAQTTRVASRSISGKTTDPNEFTSLAKNEIQLLCLQSHEATLIFLETLYFLSEQLKLSNSQITFGYFFGALKDVLSCPQNSVSAVHCLKLMGNTIQQFSSFVLKENKTCNESCNLLLPYCGSSFSAVREVAAEAVYILIRNNFLDTKKNIGKVKVQLTVALSQQETANPLNLKLGLTYITALAMSENTLGTSFAKLVQDTVNRLISIMMDNLRINKHRDDPEMMLDMYASLANNYRGAPDLRLAVLDTMSDLHAKLSNFAEAGFCKLHGAALISEYLKFKRSNYGGPLGAADFIFCSQNILEEPSMETDIDPEFEGICQSPAFSELGIVEMIEKAITFLKRAQYHEIVIECYKLIIPIFEKKFNYHHLIRCYGSIKEAYEDIVASTGKRIVGTYFRVTFSGAKFGALNGKQYIYKENSVTQLSEIVNRLTEIFKARFGNDFEFVLDSSKDKQKEDKACLSISFCEPYFNDQSESDQQSNNVAKKLFPLNKFFFDVPFTAGGKAHGEVDTQQKRKYIMQVERPFPFITKRIQVVSTKEQVLSPIEVSIETVAERCEKLRTVVKAPAPNLKSVQLLLQGAVRPQVNKGPLEIGQVFLDGKNADKYPAKHIAELKLQLQNLVNLCEQALKYSQAHSPADQHDYNEDLATGFHHLKMKMNQLINGNSGNRPPSDPTLNFMKETTKILFNEQDQASKVLANFLSS